MDNRPIRIGRINYTNVWPIFYYFSPERFGDQVSFVSEVPTSLNKAMQRGEVDMGPISSFGYGQSFEDYVLFPDLSVSAFGRVNSLLLFHRKPLKEIANGKIALTTASATTANLLKIIMNKYYGGSPTYFDAAPDLQKMMEQADAALLIGDDAIRENRLNTQYSVTDLGECWKQHTGMWMSFAVWAVRKQAVMEQPQLVSEIYDEFVTSKRKGLAQPEGMIQDAQAAVGGTTAFWQHYFSNLTYDFGPDQWAGLELYFQYAWELGLLDKPVTLNIWQNRPTAQVKE